MVRTTSPKGTAGLQADISYSIIVHTGATIMTDDSELVDQIFHIEEMKRELSERSDGQMIMGNMSDELTPEIESQFLEHVLAFEDAAQITHKALLARDGVALPAPDELNADELALKLIEIIHTLAEHHIYIENTNHLSDRELYTRLCEDILNEWEPDLPADNPMNCHIDLVGSGSEEDICLWLIYYADEATRTGWAKDFPDLDVPPHTDPPYDRDRHLPTPPPPSNPYDDPKYVEAWWAECRVKLLQKLSADGIVHGAIGEEPLSYAPDLACVCSIARLNAPDIVDWWAICGDLPTTYLPAADIPDPRAFLRIVSQRWRAATEAMEHGNPPTELAIGAPKDWPRLIPLLRRRADTLEEWAGDDEAWEE